MSDLTFSLLPAAMQPLLNKFYRAHQNGMQAKTGDQMWVAKAGEIVGALCLRPVAQDAGLWLTGLLVAPARRQQGLASELVKTACRQAGGSVWLFCHPSLADFYSQLGFAETEHLPQQLAERFSRYRRSKPLLALHRDGQPLASTG
jgi:N-acetylglutamate synthase-like GNAT family acetyltransferase